ncbi:hypothetical protein VZT92_015683 [Zoarces viviparus]|uniref:Uncharacterized protein n=1 Tax=Zoarces viviparus TaxID=48416 RepID=A0AAW1EXR5_ZOAVI
MRLDTWTSHHPPTSPHHELFTRARHGDESTQGGGISKQKQGRGAVRGCALRGAPGARLYSSKNYLFKSATYRRKNRNDTVSCEC